MADLGWVLGQMVLGALLVLGPVVLVAFILLQVRNRRG